MVVSKLLVRTFVSGQRYRNLNTMHTNERTNERGLSLSKCTIHLVTAADGHTGRMSQAGSLPRQCCDE